MDHKFTKYPEGFQLPNNQEVYLRYKTLLLSYSKSTSLKIVGNELKDEFWEEANCPSRGMMQVGQMIEKMFQRRSHFVSDKTMGEKTGDKRSRVKKGEKDKTFPRNTRSNPSHAPDLGQSTPGTSSHDQVAVQTPVISVKQVSKVVVKKSCMRKSCGVKH